MSEKTPTKKRRGRPAIGRLIGVRWDDDELRQIDDWCLAQEDQPKRAEAIRRLVRLGLRLRPAGKRGH